MGEPAPLIAAYVRCSTHEQTVESQRHAIETYIERRPEWDQVTVQWFVDNGVSATIPPANRPEFGRLLTACRAGQINQIVALRLDRLFRSARDLHDFLHEVVDPDHGLAVRLELTQQNLGDLHSPMGRAMIGLLGIMAQFERDLIVERTKEGLAAARARGACIGRPHKYLDALDDDKVANAAYDFRAGTITLSEAARRAKIPRTSFRRVLDTVEDPKGPATGATPAPNGEGDQQ